MADHDVSPGQPPGTELDYAQVTSPVSITATTDATAQALITGNPILLSGNVRVKIEFYAAGWSIGSTSEAIVVLYDGATDLARIGLAPQNASGTLDTPSSPAYFFLTPSAGVHTFSIKAWKAGGSGVSMYAGVGGAGVVMPAFYRVTVA